MNPYLAYRRHEPSAGWARIDLLLALYDKALDHLDRAEVAIKADDMTAAAGRLVKTQMILTALATGVRPEVDEETGVNMLRLYEYASHELARPRLDGVLNARSVLRTLRDGFENVRQEAISLEKAGMFPTVRETQFVYATV